MLTSASADDGCAGWGGAPTPTGVVWAPRGGQGIWRPRLAPTNPD